MTDELKALAESLDAWADLVEQGYEVPAAALIMRRAATALAALRETHHLIPKDQKPVGWVYSTPGEPDEFSFSRWPTGAVWRQGWTGTPLYAPEKRHD